MPGQYKHSAEFTARTEVAEQNYSDFVPHFREAMHFIAPDRVGEFDQYKTQNRNPDAAADQELYFGRAQVYAEGFADDLFGYHTPSESRWVDFQWTEADETEADTIQEQVSLRESDIAGKFKASNYYDIGRQAFFDANIGNVAMRVYDPHVSLPLFFDPIPLSELRVAMGEYGGIDRGHKRVANARHLKQILPRDAVLPDDTEKKMAKKPPADFDVLEFWWLDWDDPANPTWVYEISVDGKCVYNAKRLPGGVGACPVLTGRFNPRSKSPYGQGPAIVAMADLRMLNQISEHALRAIELRVEPPFTYPGDSHIDFGGQGLAPGMAYPIPQYSKNGIEPIQLGTDVETSWFAAEEYDRQLRKFFFQDGPEQRGDTPPTATQWASQTADIQRRLGKPSAPIFTEFTKHAIQHVEWRMVQSGELDQGVTQNGSVITLLPISPLQKASNQAQVQTSRANMQTAFEILGEGATLVIDMHETVLRHVRATNDELTATLTRDQALEIAQQQGTPDAGL